MKKLFTLLMLGATMSVSAQCLPNVGFDNWKGSGNAGSTYQSSTSALVGGKTNDGYRKRPGDEPSEWFGSSINQKVAGVEKTQVLIRAVSESSNTWAELTNQFVGISIAGNQIGSVAPGYLTFGTPWVYAVSTVSKCDGGTFGGVDFSCKPDAIVGKYKKTSVAKTENSYIVAYIWNGTFKSQIASTSTADADKIKEDVDRAILGSQPNTGFDSPSVVSQKGNLIAYCNKQFVSTENDDWEAIEVPMTYIEANKGLVPAKMNVVICAGDYKTRANLQDGTKLEVDDVDFVYWNTLSSLKYDGSELLEGETTTYSVDAEYDAEKLVATAKSQFAEISTSYDEVTAVATVTVTRENAEDKTYTIQFKKPVSELVVPVTLNSKYAYTTICVPFDSPTPYYGTVDAWTVDGIEDNGATLVLTKIGGQLKAHQPVLLENWGLDMSEELRGFPTEGTPKAGLLTGTYEDIKAPKGSYVLQYQNETLGFYKVEDVQPTVKAYRAYLNVDSNVKAFGFSTENGETAIKALEALTSGKPEIYDLNGRKLNKLQKGVNIVNGVKVLVK